MIPRKILALTFPVILIASEARAAGPSADTAKQVLEKRLLQLKPDGMSERQVLFQKVTPGPANGGDYAFTISLVIRDYGPGYPANGFFGETCVRRLDNQTYHLITDGGSWTVQGVLTPSNSDCKRNPAASVSATPLATLSGSAAAKSAIAPPAAGSAALYIGEYACYGAGGRLMAGMGFKLRAGGHYTDVDGGRGGSYSYNTGAATIAFQGGYLGSQVGRHVTPRGFALTDSVNCEPWR